MKEDRSQLLGETGKMAQYTMLAEHMASAGEMGRDIRVLSLASGIHMMQTEIRNQEKNSRNAFTADCKK